MLTSRPTVLGLQSSHSYNGECTRTCKTCPEVFEQCLWLPYMAIVILDSCGANFSLDRQNNILDCVLRTYPTNQTSLMFSGRWVKSFHAKASSNFEIWVLPFARISFHIRVSNSPCKFGPLTTLPLSPCSICFLLILTDLDITSEHFLSNHDN